MRGFGLPAAARRVIQRSERQPLTRSAAAIRRDDKPRRNLEAASVPQVGGSRVDENGEVARQVHPRRYFNSLDGSKLVAQGRIAEGPANYLACLFLASEPNRINIDTIATASSLVVVRANMPIARFVHETDLIPSESSKTGLPHSR